MFSFKFFPSPIVPCGHSGRSMPFIRPRSRAFAYSGRSPLPENSSSVQSFPRSLKTRNGVFFWIRFGYKRRIRASLPRIDHGTAPNLPLRHCLTSALFSNLPILLHFCRFRKKTSSWPEILHGIYMQNLLGGSLWFHHLRKQQIVLFFNWFRKLFGHFSKAIIQYSEETFYLQNPKTLPERHLLFGQFYGKIEETTQTSSGTLQKIAKSQSMGLIRAHLAYENKNLIGRRC